MKDKVVVVRTVTKEGEAKESQVTLSMPEDLTEASREWSKDSVFKLACRMFVLDKTNAERVALRGGEAKLARKEASDLAKQLLADPELLAKIKKQLS
ncbi:hypothetical protein LCGC14_0611160 [marine sediment metagenome]|uniref:Uncharacterized protein n=1 Tax=marine sediment metagenome TaxID=412755 RepID=A0A0F9RC96_9ZZZZ